MVLPLAEEVSLVFVLHLDQKALKHKVLPNDFKPETSGPTLKSTFPLYVPALSHHDFHPLPRGHSQPNHSHGQSFCSCQSHNWGHWAQLSTHLARPVTAL